MPIQLLSLRGESFFTTYRDDKIPQDINSVTFSNFVEAHINTYQSCDNYNY